MTIFDDRDQYQSFELKHSGSTAKRSSGFHIGSKNIVAVFERDETQALTTSLHEATHVITRGNFGKLPRWLNEGLAEYMEPIRNHSQTIEIRPHKVWLKYLKAPYLSIDEILSRNNKRWRGADSTKMYAYSWALIVEIQT